MTKAKPEYTPDPRIWTEEQTAFRAGMGPNTWPLHKDAYEAQGFPKIDPLLNGRDSVAIEDWYDQRSGLSETTVVANDDVDKRLEEM